MSDSLRELIASLNTRLVSWHTRSSTTNAEFRKEFESIQTDIKLAMDQMERNIRDLIDGTQLPKD